MALQSHPHPLNGYLDTLDPGGQQVMSVLLENLVQEALESTQKVPEAPIEAINIR